MVPNNNWKLSGEVKGDCITFSRGEAGFRDLEAQFLDYAISQVIEPYREVTNRLISIVNEDAYRRKEKLWSSLPGVR